MAAKLKALYDLESLQRDADWPVLVVENAAIFTACLPYIPTGWLATTWEGGLKGIKKTDWSPLAGHEVSVWQPPGDDGPAISHHIGVAVQGAHIIIPPSDGAFSGAVEVIEKIILDSIKPQPTPLHTASQEPVAHANGHEVIKPKEPILPLYRVLGHADQKYYFLCGLTQEILCFTSKDLRTGNAAQDLVPDELYWARITAESMRNGINWKFIGNTLLKECTKKGRFSFTRVRGRGVWMDGPEDNQRVVTHLGDQVWIGDQRIHPILMDTKYIYTLSDPLTDIADVEPLTDDEGLDLVTLCRKPNWAKKLNGDMLAGIIATSMICGTLPFRTHAWVTGPSGSGKSWILQQIVARALGKIALNVIGNSSEAGIRQATSQDCRPVIYDEAEGNGQAGRLRRELIIQLMRAASASADGEIIKGGATHKSQGFRVKTQFILGSIGVGIRQQADETRTLILTLRSQDVHNDAARKDQARHFADLQDHVNALPKNLPERLLRRMVNLVPVIQANAERFRFIISRNHANSRIGDQLGTVMAGRAALTCSRVLSDPEIEEYLKAFAWDQYKRTIMDGDESALLTYMATYQIQVETTDRTFKRSIAEICQIAAGNADDVIGHRAATDTLRRHGIRVDVLRINKLGEIDEEHGDPKTGISIANQHDQLDRIMRDSPYPEGYDRILERVKGHQKHENPLRFAGVLKRATWLPLAVFVGEMPDQKQGSSAVKKAAEN